MIGRDRDINAARTLALLAQAESNVAGLGQADQLTEALCVSHDVCLGDLRHRTQRMRWVVPNKVYHRRPQPVAVITFDAPVRARPHWPTPPSTSPPRRRGPCHRHCSSLATNHRQLWMTRCAGLRTCQQLLSTRSGGDAFARSPRALDPSPIGIPSEPMIVEL